MASPEGWQKVLESVMPAVVALQVTAVRSFQDDFAGAHGGTGFVVDAERGLILTNRHVCTCGPERAAATFVGCAAMEEVRVHIEYVDPTHDFAFLRFDPSQLEQTPRVEIKLDPFGCLVGEEIRVIGNDSLEKLQILSGTIARVDRNAPDLAGDYQDENTFYALAGSGTRGGSSGSPVLSRTGAAVALNAAAVSDTMHGLFLPVHRVAWALEAVRRGSLVPRGTLCSALTYVSFPECVRLGVSKEFVKEVVGNAPEGGTFSKTAPPSGMLKVQRCIPGSAAANAFQPGDVLLEIAGKPCVDFVLFDIAVDSAVGKHIPLSVCRGGERIEVVLEVLDLHHLVPRSFIEVGLGIFHDVPYQTAQKHHIPLEGVYVAQAGFVFGEHVRSDAVILAIDGEACPDLVRFEELLRQIPDNEHFSVSWMVPRSAKLRRRCESVVKMQRQWYTFRKWTLDPRSRVWSPLSLHGSKALPSGVSEVAPCEPPVKKRKTGVAPLLGQSLCSVVFKTLQHFDMDLILDPQMLDGDVICSRGTGVVVDAEAGIVLTDRTAVPQNLGDIEVTLGDTTRSASVLFMHPIHSIVFLRLDRGAFGKSVEFLDQAFESGDEVEFVGLDSQGQAFARQVNIRSVRLGKFPVHWPLRWHERNLEVVRLVDEQTTSGVLCDTSGRVLALYITASANVDGDMTHLRYGMPSFTVIPLIHRLTHELSVPSLDIEFGAVDLRKLRRLPARMRPPSEWLQKVAHVGSALQVWGTCATCELVREGDLLMEVNGRPVACVRAVEDILRELHEASDSKRSSLKVQLSLWRHGRKHDVEVLAPLHRGDGTSRLLSWNGLLLRDTPRVVRDFATSGVHIAQTLLGSPGEANGIEGDLLIAVDGVPTPTLEAVLSLDAPCRGFGRHHIRVETADIKGERFMATLEPDPLFWPTCELSQDHQGVWSCVEVGEARGAALSDQSQSGRLEGSDVRQPC